MILVGIADDHCASCAISINGEIVYAASEERFTRVKNDAGFPLNALEKGFEVLCIKPHEVDKFLFTQTDRRDFIAYEYKRESLLSISDAQKLMHDYWEPRLAGKNYPKMLPLELLKSKESFQKGFYGIPIEYAFKEYSNEKYQHICKSALVKYFEIDEDKIEFIDHHTCHAYYALSTIKKRPEGPFAVVTVDSWGDGKNQTVWRGEENSIQLIAQSSTCHLARIYRFTTLYLGMRPNEHEYKVMGLSAYPESSYSKEILTQLSKLVKVEGLKIICPVKVENMYNYLSDVYKGCRFDNIARAVQDLVENNLLELFENIAKEVKVKNFFYTGGVAMNVKANQKILESGHIKSLFVPGAPDDTSVPIGACLFYSSNKNLQLPFNSVKNMYLGESIEQIEPKDLDKINSQFKVTIKENISPNDISKIIMNGEVVARASGKMEFGARALGNRSLFALPSNWDSVDTINYLIKQRDFWMPFAGSVLEDDVEKVIGKSWKNSDPRFMTISFKTISNYYPLFKAATHRKDKTIRIHVVTKEDNPWYYDLLEAIKCSLGIGVILNTSFNLHGYPVVRTKEEAINIFCKTELKHLVLADSLISKN